MTAFRSLAFNIGYILITLMIGLVGLPLLLGPRRVVLAWARLWVRAQFLWLRLTTGITWELRGAEYLPKGGAILAAKHQSAWDVLALILLLREPTFVHKRELFWVPIFGWYLWAIRMIPIDRAAAAAAMRSMMTKAKAAMARGETLVIFPEGTRGPPGARLPYKPGVIGIYAALGVPLVPVALNSGLVWGRNAFLKHPGHIVIQILPPLPPGLDRRRVLGLLEEQIEGQTARLLAEAGWHPHDQTPAACQPPHQPDPAS